MSGYLGEGYGMHRDSGNEAGGEGRDPRAREAAAEWQQRFGREGHEGSYARHLHDRSYQSFRERHLAELDRDYDEWCREREQAFHRDFDDFRSRRQGGDAAGLQPGMIMMNDPGDSSTLAEDHAADTLVAAQEEGGGTPRRRKGR